MKIKPQTFPGIPDIEMGRTLGFEIELTPTERVTLREAKKLAENIRTQLRKVFGQVDADDLEADTMIAGIEHGCDDLLNGIDLPAKE